MTSHKKPMGVNLGVVMILKHIITHVGKDGTEMNCWPPTVSQMCVKKD